MYMMLFILFLSAFAHSGCTSEPYQAPGTKLMAQRLAKLVDGINPEENIYLSAHRVAWLRKRPPAKSAAQKLSHQIELAKELLQAGESAAAADLFQTVRGQACRGHRCR